MFLMVCRFGIPGFGAAHPPQQPLQEFVQEGLGGVVDRVHQRRARCCSSIQSLIWRSQSASRAWSSRSDS